MPFAADALAHALEHADADPGARAAFYATLREAQVWFLAPLASSGTGAVSLLPCDGEDGPFVPMFSSPERMQAAVGAQRGWGAVAARVADVFPLLAARRLSVQLNPGTNGKAFPPEEVSAIADGSLLAAREVGLHDATEARIRRLRRTPDRLSRRLAAVFARYADIAEAWLGEMLLADERPHLVVGVKAAHGYASAIAEAGPEAQGLLPAGQVIDFVQIAYACAPDGIAGWLVRETRPFYERDRRRWWRGW